MFRSLRSLGITSQTHPIEITILVKFCDTIQIRLKIAQPSVEQNAKNVFVISCLAIQFLCNPFINTIFYQSKKNTSMILQDIKVTLLSAAVGSELPFCKTTLLRKQLISPILFVRSKIGKKYVVLHGLGSRKICKSQCFR